jgi:hypothetical protein
VATLDERAGHASNILRAHAAVRGREVLEELRQFIRLCKFVATAEARAGALPRRLESSLRAQEPRGALP